ncbi:potassium channel family protein [Jeotgalibaca caeni]|uniref:potassium channel family protein n=1 Tax=Jeotgalibaca caeni TaxID=3028623 RepID=UPI00237D6001|nr:TrkA family potassium uptake protein [Jeotgalibaca caeni]MDE1548505.1 TrkA family potassium uptake protein [Jeotgalibaca caeni]
MKKIVGVLGLGIFGSAIAQTLAEHEHEVIAVDKNIALVNQLDPYIAKGVVGDITDFEFLKTIGIGDCDMVVISTGTVLEASVLAVMHCKNLGIPHIIAKAKSQIYRDVLQEIGAHTVILPEHETGIRVAKNIMRNRIEDIVMLDERTSIVEFYAPENWVGKPLRDLDLRNRYELNIIGMREHKDAPFSVAISAETIVREGVLFFGVTESTLFEKQDYFQQPYD